jgi:uncharacterized coiled-coil protein SlyX
VATILELARHAEVSAESVLRVVNGEPVSGEIAERVNRAIEELGPPAPSRALQPLPAEEAAESPSQELLDSFTAKLEEKLPGDVGNVVYEAVRVEVRPMQQHLAQMEQLCEQVVRRIEEVGESERRERLEDVALLVELVTTTWRTVDRRLGRLERMLERLEAEQAGEPDAGEDVPWTPPAPEQPAPASS